MKTSTLTRVTMLVLIGAAVAPLAPAVAQDGAWATADRVGSQAPGGDHDPVVIRRDSDRAVPFAPYVRSSSPGAGLSQGDGFDWGAAAVGAAGAIGLMLLASTAWTVTHRRRRSSLPPTVAA